MALYVLQKNILFPLKDILSSRSNILIPHSNISKTFYWHLPQCCQYDIQCCKSDMYVQCRWKTFNAFRKTFYVVMDIFGLNNIYVAKIILNTAAVAFSAACMIFNGVKMAFNAKRYSMMIK